MRNQIASIGINQSEETYLVAPKSLYKGEPLSCLEEDFWTSGKTWGWAVGGPGWDCSYETGDESHASILQKIIFTIRLRVSLEMTKPLGSSWGTKKEKSSSGSTLRWNIIFYKSNWFLQHIFNPGFLSWWAGNFLGYSFHKKMSV